MENDHFKSFLEARNSEYVDEMVHQINQQITPQVNCLDCGNCCRSLMINIEENEVAPVAQLLKMSSQQLKEKYIETSLQGHMVMNTIPCSFLQTNACTIYEDRFNECREFPGLHRPHFTRRLFATFMHYGRCPIIYNVIEQLKIETEFHQAV